jgi:fructose-1,6-bisphosphatase/inositol monophosphatase family enzyme
LPHQTFDIFVDGTTNFAHGYPSFAVSVGVLFRGKPAAAAVVLINKPDCILTCNLQIAYVDIMRK